MITRRYTALALISLAMLLVGFAALGAPGPMRGPLVSAGPFSPGGLLGLSIFTQPLYLTDAIGLILLALATLEIWVIAITWEYRRQRNRPINK